MNTQPALSIFMVFKGINPAIAFTRKSQAERYIKEVVPVEPDYDPEIPVKYEEVKVYNKVTKAMKRLVKPKPRVELPAPVPSLKHKKRNPKPSKRPGMTKEQRDAKYNKNKLSSTPSGGSFTATTSTPL